MVPLLFLRRGESGLKMHFLFPLEARADPLLAPFGRSHPFWKAPDMPEQILLAFKALEAEKVRLCCCLRSEATIIALFRCPAILTLHSPRRSRSLAPCVRRSSSLTKRRFKLARASLPPLPRCCPGLTSSSMMRGLRLGRVCPVQ